MRPPGSSTSRFRSSLLSISVLLSATAVHLEAADGHGMSMDGLARVWKAKHEKYRTGRLTWDETRWFRRGRIPALRGGGMGPSGDPVPATDSTFEYKCSLAFDGELMRYECDGPVWFDITNKFEPHLHVDVWDGKAGKVFHRSPGRPTGQIYDLSMELTQPSLWAPRTCFRMLHPQWANLEIDKFVLLPSTEMIDGRECLILETAPVHLTGKTGTGLARWKSRYAVSRDQDYGLVLFTLTSADYREPVQEYTVEYTSDAKHGWIPTRWKRVEGPKAEPREIVEAKVTGYEFNMAIPPETFTYSFPKNTYVRDDRKDELYIARGGDEKRIVTREELMRGATYEELLTTESGAAHSRTRSKSTIDWTRWGIAGFGVGGLVLAFVIAKRRNSG